jgi:GNAT superfamily N-acetyltransferase
MLQAMDEKNRAFTEWLSAPVDFTSRDSRFEVRRAAPNDFPRIHDLVDTVFDRSRSRAAYDWLYLANPVGIARCTLVFERCSGELVSSRSGWPWPVAHGSKRIEGQLGGDVVTLPRLQRQGIGELRRQFNEAHPCHGHTIKFGIPNAKSRAVTTKYGRVPPFGPLPNGTLVLDSANYLQSRSLPRRVARIIGKTADLAMDRWRDKTLASPSNIRIEELQRFESDIDELTYRCMSTPTYWCPHEAEFLNWRYLENPLNSYLSQAVLEGDEIKAYSVIRIKDKHAILMEFVAPRVPKSLASALLHAIIQVARDAGCNEINFYATSSWRFWSIFRQAGFFKRGPEVYVTARCPNLSDVSEEEKWQLLPGDSDVI